MVQLEVTECPTRLKNIKHDLKIMGMRVGRLHDIKDKTILNIPSMRLSKH